MTKEITIYEKAYDVFIERVEKPIRVSGQGGEILKKMLSSPNCPSFVPIGENLYNKFNIERVELHEEEITPERQKALAYNLKLTKKYEEHKARKARAGA